MFTLFIEIFSIIITWLISPPPATLWLLTLILYGRGWTPLSVDAKRQTDSPERHEKGGGAAEGRSCCG